MNGSTVSFAFVGGTVATVNPARVRGFQWTLFEQPGELVCEMNPHRARYRASVTGRTAA